ncbi:MAG: exodeoxyribonuclease VII small subunit [Bacteroidales bacterium]|nr:exodeoxyribonuclease VII small subunit [Bacteroidales bacterium]
MEKFDYGKALARLEEIAKKVEDPSTALDDIDACLKESDELIGACRKYLRTLRENLENLDK